MANPVTLGQVYVFSVLFLDSQNTPINATSVTIDLFYYVPAPAGPKTYLVQAQPMNPVTPPEAGRFVYPYLVSRADLRGVLLHAEMRGTDPLTSAALLATEDIETVVNGSTTTCSGLVARFIP